MRLEDASNPLSVAELFRLLLLLLLLLAEERIKKKFLLSPHSLVPHPAAGQTDDGNCRQNALDDFGRKFGKIRKNSKRKLITGEVQYFTIL